MNDLNGLGGLTLAAVVAALALNSQLEASTMQSHTYSDVTVTFRGAAYYRLHTKRVPGPGRRETSEYLGTLEKQLHVSLSPKDSEGKQFAYSSASGPAMAQLARCKHGAQTFFRRAARARASKTGLAPRAT